MMRGSSAFYPKMGRLTEIVSFGVVYFSKNASYL